MPQTPHQEYQVGDELVIVAQKNIFEPIDTMPCLGLHVVRLKIKEARLVDLAGSMTSHWGYLAEGSDGWGYEHNFDMFRAPKPATPSWYRHFLEGVHFDRNEGSAKPVTWKIPAAEFNGHYLNWTLPEALNLIPRELRRQFVTDINLRFPSLELTFCDRVSVVDGVPMGHSLDNTQVFSKKIGCQFCGGMESFPRSQGHIFRATWGSRGSARGASRGQGVYSSEPTEIYLVLMSRFNSQRQDILSQDLLMIDPYSEHAAAAMARRKLRAPENPRDMLERAMKLMKYGLKKTA